MGRKGPVQGPHWVPFCGAALRKGDPWLELQLQPQQRKSWQWKFPPFAFWFLRAPAIGFLQLFPAAALPVLVNWISTGLPGLVLLVTALKTLRVL